MPTNSIGAGTCNISINVPTQERSIIGRAAFARIQSGEFRSVGAYLRYLILRGMEVSDPDSALRLRAIRNGAMAFALFLLIGITTVLQWFDHGDDDSMLRARRGRSAARAAMRSAARARMEGEAV